MKYYHNLYLSEGFHDKKDIIIEKLERRQIQLNKYLVVLTKSDVNHLEFFDSVLLKQNELSKRNYFLSELQMGILVRWKWWKKSPKKCMIEQKGRIFGLIFWKLRGNMKKEKYRC